MSVRWLMAFIGFFIICTLISNILEGQAMQTDEQISTLNEMSKQEFTEAKDLGFGVTTTGVNPVSVLKAIWKSLTMDYSFLYDVYYGITEDQCTDLHGTWQDTTSTCKVPNVWLMPFMILIYGPLVGVAFYLILTLATAIRGGSI